MHACDILIVGGGPAGSSCAWKLRQSGLDVAIMDRQKFPRDKICGGWITPQILEELDIDAEEYGRDRTLQPITGFRTGSIGGAAVETDYARPVSFGIRRCEFDDFLLKRAGAELFLGAALESLEKSGDGWIINRNIRTKLIIGAGGHFCPVARFMGVKTSCEMAVVAQEAEFLMDPRQVAQCRIRGDVPELYFSSDLKGYGWCFRKGDFLNVGLGRLDPRRLSAHVAEFIAFLKAAGRLSFDVPAPRGHAYLLYGSSGRDVAGDGWLLIGDAAGLAYSQSGEGIRPAVESGLLAAETIAGAGGHYGRERLGSYRGMLTKRFGATDEHWMTRVGRRLPSRWIRAIGRRLPATPWFAREVVLNRWFLHSGEPALVC